MRALEKCKVRADVDCKVKITDGDGGVMRYAYIIDGVQVGIAHVLGETIGSIEIKEQYRRKGYGKLMIEDLWNRGGRTATCVTEASRALFKSVGAKEYGPKHFTIPEEAFQSP